MDEVAEAWGLIDPHKRQLKFLHDQHKERQLMSRMFFVFGIFMFGFNYPNANEIVDYFFVSMVSSCFFGYSWFAEQKRKEAEIAIAIEKLKEL